MDFEFIHRNSRTHGRRSLRFQQRTMDEDNLTSKSKIGAESMDDLCDSSPAYWNPEISERKEHCIDLEKKLLHNAMDQAPLKQEIIQLEKRLKDQLKVRHCLEKTLGYRKSVVDYSNDSTPKPAKELIREIAVLEVEVTHLEQYLLSLYRKAFDQQIPVLTSSTPKFNSKQSISCQRRLFHDHPGPEISSCTNHPLVHSTRILPSQISACKLADESTSESIEDRSVYRSHSALNPSEAALARALQDCQSQPLSFLTDWQDSNSGVINLAGHLGFNITDHVLETANKISEDMIRCMGAIFAKLADPPVLNPGLATSPASSFSSLSAISPDCTGDMWSPGFRHESILDTRLVNPFCTEGLKEFSGPYNAMVEVSSIKNDDRRLKTVEDLLNAYRSLVHKLATVNVKKMKNDEKLPFWVNLHNALMMHAYLVHGVSSSIKRSLLMIKATCTVGGHSFNADMIRSSFLWCHTHWSGQWFRTFMLPMLKFKTKYDWKRLYAIEKQEPLLHFALCSGSHSDPAVRIYTSQQWRQQLETAREEYIRASVGVQKEQVFLPKLIETYAKDSCMSSQKVVDMTRRYLPETLSMAIARCQRGRSHKIIEWVPHNFNFRYLLTKEVANPQII